MVPEWVKLEGPGLKGAPDLYVELEIRGGVPEVVDFRLAAKPNGRGVRTSDLRVFHNLDGFAYNAFVRVPGSSETGKHWAEPPADQREHWKRRGDFDNATAKRPRVSTAELEDVARVYRENIGHRPTESVQTEFGYSRRTAARRVQQARAAGLLPVTSRGKRRA